MRCPRSAVRPGFHDAAVAPYWDRMRTTAVAPAQAWMHTMSTQRLEALLNGLHPRHQLASTDAVDRSPTGATVIQGARTERW